MAECWIVDPAAETLEQYRRPAGGDLYELAIKALTGEVRSFAVPGFVIPVRAIFDQAQNQAALQVLLSSETKEEA